MNKKKFMEGNDLVDYEKNRKKKIKDAKIFAARKSVGIKWKR